MDPTAIVSLATEILKAINLATASKTPAQAQVEQAIWFALAKPLIRMVVKTLPESDQAELQAQLAKLNVSL